MLRQNARRDGIRNKILRRELEFTVVRVGRSGKVVQKEMWDGTEQGGLVRY